MFNSSAFNSLGRAFLILFMLDVLFAPYILPVPVPLSGLLMPFWILITGVRVPTKEWAWPVLGCLAVAISYIAGLYTMIHDPEVLQSRLVNTGILIYMFVALVLCERDSRGNSSVIIRVLQVYIAFSFLLALVFFASPNMYFVLREEWTFSKDIVHVSSITVLVRYTGILSDPNNMAASTAAVSAMLVFLEPRRLVRNATLIGMTAVIVVATMSVTGFICLLILGGAFIFLAHFQEDRALNVAMRILAFAVLTFISFGVYLMIRDQLIFQLALERLSGSDVDSRLSRWGIVFDYSKIVESVLIGDGGSIFWQRRDYHPHNGHIHIIFAFGIVAYLAFVRVFFRYRRNLGASRAVFLLMLVIVFTVNVGVYEHRFAGIWVILMALYAEASRCQASISRGREQQEKAGSAAVILA